jgi:hypothetical protein
MRPIVHRKAAGEGDRASGTSIGLSIHPSSNGLGAVLEGSEQTMEEVKVWGNVLRKEHGASFIDVLQSINQKGSLFTWCSMFRHSDRRV